MTGKRVDQYIADFPPKVRERLLEIRGIIKEVAPEAVESMAYRMPAYKLDGKPLIYFAGFENHIGIYPLPEVIREMGEELSKYKQGKGSIQIMHDQPLPADLVRRIVKARIGLIQP
jgi:uncharacterized protein YdhG (YjbR/CyaY superfamily)